MEDPLTENLNIIKRVGELRAKIAEKENAERELMKELSTLKDQLRRELVGANRQIESQILALDGVPVSKAAASTAPNGMRDARNFTDNMHKVGKMDQQPIFREIIMDIVTVFNKNSPTVTKSEISAVILDKYHIENSNSFGTFMNQHLKYMINKKTIERVSLGVYRWIGKPLDKELENYVPLMVIPDTK